MKYSQDMNQLESVNAPPKDVTGGLVGSTKGAVGPLYHIVFDFPCDDMLH